MSKPISERERLIFALDVPDFGQAENLVNELRGIVSFYKVGWELFLAEGLSIVRWLKDQDLKVFLDLKLQDDVDATITRYMNVVVNERPDLITLHGNGKMFETARRAKGNAPVKILSLTALSTMDRSDMRDAYMIQNGSDFSLPFKTPEEYILWKAQRSVQAGCDGLITSGRFVKMLAKTFKDSLIVVPGIRPSGSSPDEHKNVLTPKQAIQSGADYLVVGRPIRDAQNPRAAAIRILDEISGAKIVRMPRRKPQRYKRSSKDQIRSVS